MTDDQVLAKVRAATTRALENMTCLCVGEGGRTPVATCKHCHGSGYLVTDETISARAALAMVDAIVRCDDAIAELTALPEYPPSVWQQGRLAVWRELRTWLLSALRTAVGE